jgi:hypothetical protein
MYYRRLRSVRGLAVEFTGIRLPRLGWQSSNKLFPQEDAVSLMGQVGSVFDISWLPRLDSQHAGAVHRHGRFRGKILVTGRATESAH